MMPYFMKNIINCLGSGNPVWYAYLNLFGYCSISLGMTYWDG